MNNLHERSQDTIDLSAGVNASYASMMAKKNNEAKEDEEYGLSDK